MLIYDDNNEMIQRITVTNDKSTDITNYLKGKKQPSAIIMNSEDNGYFSQIFDERSANWLVDNIYVIFYYKLENNLIYHNISRCERYA